MFPLFFVHLHTDGCSIQLQIVAPLNLNYNFLRCRNKSGMTALIACFEIAANEALSNDDIIRRCVFTGRAQKSPAQCITF